MTTAVMVVPHIVAADPPPALCQPPQVGAGNGSAGSCFDSSGKSFYPVADNQDKGTSPEAGHCYTTKSTGFGLLYYNADCSQPPFNQARVITCSDGATVIDSTSATPDSVCQSHGGAATNVQDPAEVCAQQGGNCNQIYTYINLGINFLSAGVGIVVVAMIIIGGIQYASAEDDPQRVAAARSRVFNALLALVAYIFLFAFLQWLVPGGIFK